MCLTFPMRLATKTALIFSVFALFCVGATTALLLRQSRMYMEEAVSERQALFADAQAVTLRERLTLVGDALLRLSHAVAGDAPTDDATNRNARLHDAFRQSPILRSGAQLFNESGACIWAEPNTVPCNELSYRNATWLRTAASADAPLVITDVDNAGRASVMLVAATRLDNIGHRGVLRAVFDVNETDIVFGPIVRRAQSSHAELGIVAPGGLLLYSSEHLDTQHVAFRQGVNAVHRGEVGTTTDGSGRARELYVWTPVRTGHLGLVYAWPWDRIDPGSQRELVELVLLAAFVFATALLLGSIISRFVAQPIRALADAARNMAPSHDREGGPLRGDEIAALTRAFDELSQSLRERDAQIQLDMTQIKELAESLEQRVAERTRELEEAQRALVEKERFAVVGQAGAVMSHELRNSLNAVGMGVDLLVKSSDARSELKGVQQQVRAEVARLRSLSDDLLNFTKDLTLRKSIVNLRDLAQTAAALVHDDAQSEGITVDIHVPAGIMVDVDADRIQSVLVNGLRNAIEAATASEHTPKNVVVTVSAGTDGRAHVHIDDTGDGVKAELGERVFEPFVTTKRTGTGLGLATAARYVRAHGGTIHLGKGPLGGARLEFDIALTSGRELRPS